MSRMLDDPNYIIGELRFDTDTEAQDCVVALRTLSRRRPTHPSPHEGLSAPMRRGRAEPRPPAPERHHRDAASTLRRTLHPAIASREPRATSH